MSTSMIIGIVITLAVFIGLSVYAGTRVKSAADFSTGGGKSSAYIVAGTIMGTLVGGSSTIGTAQLAYNYGMSAWWFTLGGGIACLILAIGFIKPFRTADSTTLVGIVSKEYGQTSGMWASVLSSIGIFVNILTQLISAVGVIIVITPAVGRIPALIIAAVLMVIYVTLGGIKGAGMVGVLKLVLLYITVVVCAVIVVVLSKGINPLLDTINALHLKDPVHNNFGLFARGFGIDAGAGASLIFGVLTTQTYGQAIMSGKTDRVSRTGALVSTFMIPPVGICGILVGLYMRVNDPSIAKNTIVAMTKFITEHVPHFLGGIMLATLLFAVVGTGAGLALGISTIVNNDIVKKVSKKAADPKKDLVLSRVIIVAVLAVAVVVSYALFSTPAQIFAYISMGLRGAVMFMPLMLALFAKNKVKPGFIITSIIIAPLVVLALTILPFINANLALIKFDPLFIGLPLSIIICVIGLIVGKGGDVKKTLS